MEGVFGCLMVFIHATLAALAFTVVVAAFKAFGAMATLAALLVGGLVALAIFYAYAAISDALKKD